MMIHAYINRLSIYCVKLKNMDLGQIIRHLNDCRAGSCKSADTFDIVSMEAIYLEAQLLSNYSCHLQSNSLTENVTLSCFGPISVVCNRFGGFHGVWHLEFDNKGVLNFKCFQRAEHLHGPYSRYCFLKKLALLPAIRFKWLYWLPKSGSFL